MLLSKSCEYAIRATIYIARNSKKSSIIEISDAIGSPKHFTAKVLQILVRENVISSSMGPTGGFSVEQPQKVYLIDIVRAIDGERMFKSCALGLKKCSDKEPCPMHYQLLPVRTQLLKIFCEKSVNEVIDGFSIDKYYLK